MHGTPAGLQVRLGGDDHRTPHAPLAAQGLQQVFPVEVVKHREGEYEVERRARERQMARVRIDLEANLADVADHVSALTATAGERLDSTELGSVADAIPDSGDAFTLRQMHVTQIPKSAKTPDEVIEMAGLSPDRIVGACLEMLGVPV